MVRIDKFFPSSKKCSRCGKVKKVLPLSERTYRCECGNQMDRDVNAAINIRERRKTIIMRITAQKMCPYPGRKIRTAGQAEIAC